MDFLIKELLKIGSFGVQVWHIAVVAIVLIVLIIVICTASKASRKKAKAQTTEQPIADQSNECPQEQPTVEQVVEETPIEQPAEETPVEQAPEQPAEAVEQPADEQVEEAPAEESAEQVEEESAEETPTEGTETPVAKRPTVKNYHVSLRPDGKWQVKLSKGGKAIKLFDTQAEAIDFAKARAKSQDGHITIHKVDGKIRKQKY